MSLLNDYQLIIITQLQLSINNFLYLVNVEKKVDYHYRQSTLE